MEISHLLLIDDTLVFCKPSLDQLNMWFKTVSGLSINLDKNELILGGEWRM